MKKLFTLLLLTTLISVSAQQSNKMVDYKTNFNSEELLEFGKTIVDPIEKYEFYKHLFVVYQVDDLKESIDALKNDNEIIEKNNEKKDINENEKEDKSREELVSKMLDGFSEEARKEDELRYNNMLVLRQLPTPLLYDFAKKYLSEYTDVNEKPVSVEQLDKKEDDEEFTLREKIKNVDKLLIEKDSALVFYDNFSRLIQPSYGSCISLVENVEKNIIEISGSCGTGTSLHFNYVLLKDNTFIDLGNGYDKLSKSEFKKLEKAIKKQVKDYSGIAGRSEAQFSQRPNGNFFITIRGYVGEEPYSTGGSLEITYETKDLKTIIPNSITVE